MIHQPSGGMSGQFTDMEISYKLIKQLRNELYSIMAKHTGKTFEDIEKDSERDNWMTSLEAKAYGLVDEVLERGSKVTG
jgi:ATP-dependent Clp protease protease subunit